MSHDLNVGENARVGGAIFKISVEVDSDSYETG